MQNSQIDVNRLKIEELTEKKQEYLAKAVGFLSAFCFSVFITIKSSPDPNKEGVSMFNLYAYIVCFVLAIFFVLSVLKSNQANRQIQQMNKNNT